MPGLVGRIAVKLRSFPDTVSRRYIGSVITTQDQDKLPDLPPNLIILGVNKDKKRREESSSLNYKLEECQLVRKVNNCPNNRIAPRVQLHSFDVGCDPTEAVEIHPELFNDNPRIDFLYLCKKWQRNYREVDYSWQPTRAEMGKGRKKPWGQKGLGKARHGSTVAPQWKGGGIAHGPRGPRALFHKINPTVRIKGLTSALSIKYFQDDLMIFKNLNIPSSEENKLREIFAAKGMEDNSALIVYSSKDEIGDGNMYNAVQYWKEVNLMPLVGLNVWSMLHHDKLILSLTALNELETKIIWNLHRFDWITKPHNFYHDIPFEVENNVE